MAAPFFVRSHFQQGDAADAGEQEDDKKWGNEGEELPAAEDGEGDDGDTYPEDDFAKVVGVS